MAEAEHDGIAALLSLREAPGPPELAKAYDALIGGVREFLDALAGARISPADSAQLLASVEGWSAALRDMQVGERERIWGRWSDTPGRGQALVPRVYDASLDGLDYTARVLFGRYHVGENMAVHGGAVSLLFDDVLGHLGFAAGLPPSRTAFLKTNYRSVTPVGEELVVRCRLDRVEGRKRFLSGELLHGDRLCAEAEGLWVELRPGQQ
ncbi:PaaI family thioesterase [Janibacter sp. G1551]|uniref:PaaI family thioesterase n=1 Tax=Janibacter sp. G1551 TaxID=3420440 RepID=UPI003CFED57A